MTFAEWAKGNELLRKYGTTPPMVDIGGLSVLHLSKYTDTPGVFTPVVGDVRPWAHVDSSYEVINPGEGGKPGDPPVEVLATMRSRSFRTVFCTSVLEHTESPWAAMHALAAILLQGGLLYVSTPWYWPTHGDSRYDRWRFSPEGLILLCNMVGLDLLEAGFAEQVSGRETAYVCASKGPLKDRYPAKFVEPEMVRM
jgi:hypothetical protein